MNKTHKTESVNNSDISHYLKGIQAELSDIKKIMFQQVKTNLGESNESFNSLLGKEVSNVKPKKK